MCRVRDFGTLRPMGCLYQPPTPLPNTYLSKLRGLCRRRWKIIRVVDNAKETVSFRYSRTDGHMNSQRLTAHTRPVQAETRQNLSKANGK